MTAPGIRLSGLEKRFPRNRDLLRFLSNPLRREYTDALRGVDLNLSRGGVCALLGPNGAGKTTLLKLLAGLLLPDAGSIEVDGADLTNTPRRLRDLVSLAVCDERSFYWRLSGRENLRFYASLNGITGTERDAEVTRCLDLVGLTEAAGRRFMEYSSGMRQSMALARALLLDPPILLMDEPTRSLDPEATARIHTVLLSIQERAPDRIVLYSTHDLAEAESISSHVIVLRHGRVITTRELDDASSGTYTYRICTQPAMPTALLDEIPHVTVLGSPSTEVMVELSDLAGLDALIDRARSTGIRVLEVSERRSSLRELYHASSETDL